MKRNASHLLKLGGIAVSWKPCYPETKSKTVQLMPLTCTGSPPRVKPGQRSSNLAIPGGKRGELKGHPPIPGGPTITAMGLAGSL